ncbi:MAG: hypothetical protein Q4E05_06720, partial [Pseudoclavibacter sp.]|nr:hypothetical protein [Pseudoclavibacter sp.]
MNQRPDGGGGTGAILPLSPTSADGLIDPDLFPCADEDLKPDQVEASAAALRAMGAAVRDRVRAIGAIWDELPGSYEAPEQERVYALMDPAEASAEDLCDRLEKAAGHLEWFADALGQIKPRLRDVEQRARDFRAEALQGYEVSAYEAEGTVLAALFSGKSPFETVRIPWNQHGPAATRNAELLGEYQGYLGQVSSVAAETANVIKLLIVHTQGVEAAQAITSDSLTLLWGPPASEELSCGESIGHGVGTWFHNNVTGLGALIGWDPTTGSFSGELAGQAWAGLADLAGSLAVVTLSYAGLLVTRGLVHAGAGMNDDFAEWFEDREFTVAAALASVVAVDLHAARQGGDPLQAWKENGVAALTESALNVGSFFVPAGAVANALKIGGNGARAGAVALRVAAEAAEFVVPGGSWLVRGGVHVTEYGLNAVRGLEPLPPSALRPGPGALAAVTEVPHTPDLDRTPVSDSLLDGPAPVGTAGTRPAGVPDLRGERTPDAPIPPGRPDGSASPASTVPERPARPGDAPAEPGDAAAEPSGGRADAGSGRTAGGDGTPGDPGRPDTGAQADRAAEATAETGPGRGTGGSTRAPETERSGGSVPAADPEAAAARRGPGPDGEAAGAPAPETSRPTLDSGDGRTGAAASAPRPLPDGSPARRGDGGHRGEPAASGMRHERDPLARPRHEELEGSLRRDPAAAEELLEPAGSRSERRPQAAARTDSAAPPAATAIGELPLQGAAVASPVLDSAHAASHAAATTGRAASPGTGAGPGRGHGSGPGRTSSGSDGRAPTPSARGGERGGAGRSEQEASGPHPDEARGGAARGAEAPEPAVREPEAGHRGAEDAAQHDRAGGDREPGAVSRPTVPDAGSGSKGPDGQVRDGARPEEAPSPRGEEPAHAPRDGGSGRSDGETGAATVDTQAPRSGRYADGSRGGRGSLRNYLPGNRAVPDLPAPPRRTWTPEEASANGVPEFTQRDVDAARARAPRNARGEAVDVRTGAPLMEWWRNVKFFRPAERAWEMRWDPDAREWLALNPGHGWGAWRPDGSGGLSRVRAPKPSVVPDKASVVEQAARDANGTPVDYRTGAPLHGDLRHVELRWLVVDGQG